MNFDLGTFCRIQVNMSSRGKLITHMSHRIHFAGISRVLLSVSSGAFSNAGNCLEILLWQLGGVSERGGGEAFLIRANLLGGAFHREGGEAFLIRANLKIFKIKINPIKRLPVSTDG